MKLCQGGCGKPPTTPKHWYCNACREARKRHKSRVREAQSRPPAAERGYGAEHQKLRREIAVLVRTGQAKCARCGGPIRPAEAWDLDHDDDDRSRYIGASHARCNRSTRGRRRKRHSRDW